MRTAGSTPFRPIICGSLLFATALVACTKGESTDTTDSAIAADSSAMVADATPAAETNSASSSSSNANAPLVVDDLDRWQRGMAAEAAAVNDAIAKLASAKTESDSTNLMMGTAELSTRRAGADAAGIDEARYQHIASTLSNLASQLVPLEQEMDVTQMPAAMLAEMKQARAAGTARVTAGVAPEVVTAMTARATALRTQEKALLAARAKALGMGR